MNHIARPSLLRSGFRHLLKSQVRTAVCTDIRYIQRTSKSDPLTEQYKEKLLKKAQELGATDIDGLKEKLKEKLEVHRKEFAKIDPLQELEEFERQQALEAQAKKAKQDKLRDPRSPDAPEKPFKTLDSFIALDKLKELPLKEIELIWRARFQTKENSMTSLIDGATFSKFYKNARENPIFVLPVPREPEGHELHYVQWQFVGPNTIHLMFTTLLEFKTHKEYARPHTTISFHTELLESHNVVLMNGHVEKESAMTLQESQLLLLNVQRFYGALTDSEATKRRLQLLRDFTSGNERFSVEELVRESESLEN
ncbi:hypothetical protein WICPIJ_006391 [Wickerhamomyces pijperi]|uniref:ATP synthase mitochondrial F1 complex assembly factor 1 n=1 Tax=Wickerhamomyces pijperi TaxID=599730 RepID=A0A9P8Q264_WICPI|nr:hypothetical protein WICPIJ_006391 [Wickerhamomyces pijperi]